MFKQNSKNYRFIFCSYLKKIALSVIFASLFSLPLYLNIWIYATNSYLPYINSLFALLSVFVFINIDKKLRFLFGFFVGILWFYWTGMSFRFTDAPYFMWFAIICMGVGYGILLYFALFFNTKIFRAITLSLVGYVSILGFDWFVPDSLFAFSVFRVDKIAFIAIIIAMILLSTKWLKIHKIRLFTALFLLLFAIDMNSQKIELPTTNINLTQTHIAQNLKWDAQKINEVLRNNFQLIEGAINNGYDIVVLPETAFPMVLNTQNNQAIIDELLRLSHRITIVAGAQRVDNNGHYNSTYVFEKGILTFADKVFLAPFGEYMPIPKFFIDIFSKISGIQYAVFDKSKAQTQNITAKNLVFRNAICYEGTTRAIYKDNPKLVMLISNNAWFEPSIEPILQMTLIKYYARLHQSIVYHSTNGSKAGIISPNISLRFYIKDSL